MMGWLFALGGAAAGMGQASLLARAVGRESSPLSTVARLLLVGAVLLLAARTGHLVPGVVGWTAGFVGTGVVLQRSLR